MPAQILQLPQVQNILGYVFLTFFLCYIHIISTTPIKPTLFLTTAIVSDTDHTSESASRTISEHSPSRSRFCSGHRSSADHPYDIVSAHHDELPLLSGSGTLQKAISEKNMEKVMLIADHFARNPKDNPLLVTISTLFTHFQRIFILNYQKWLCRRKGGGDAVGDGVGKNVETPCRILSEGVPTGRNALPQPESLRHHGTASRIRP